MLHPTPECLQRQRDRQARDKVDIADVGKQLIVVERELAKRKVDIGIRVAGVQDRGLDEGGAAAWAAGVEEEGEFGGGREPDAAAGDLGDGQGDGVARGAERDGAVLGEGLEDFVARWGGGEVRGAVGEDEDAGLVVLDGEAGDEGVDGLGGGLVGELDC